MKLIKEERRLEIRKGAHRRWLRVFITDEGTFTMEDLAAYFDCGISKIRRDYNAYGFCPDKWAHKEQRGRKKDDPDYYGDWEGLSEASRLRNVQRIKLGSWEEEQIKRRNNHVE